MRLTSLDRETMPAIAGVRVVRPENTLELYSIIRKELSSRGMDADLNFIDTSRVMSLQDCFWGSVDFRGDVSLWDVSKVFNFDSCFYKCKNFNCDISGWDVSRGETFRYMFYGCFSLEQDLSCWKIRNDKTPVLWSMFVNCPAVKPQAVIDYETGEIMRACEYAKSKINAKNANSGA